MKIDTMSDMRFFFELEELPPVNFMFMFHHDIVPTVLLPSDKQERFVINWQRLQTRGLASMKAWYSQPHLTLSDPENSSHKYVIEDFRFYRPLELPRLYSVREAYFQPASPDVSLETDTTGTVQSLSFKVMSVTLWMRPNAVLPERAVSVSDRITELTVDLQYHRLYLW